MEVWCYGVMAVGLVYWFPPVAVHVADAALTSLEAIKTTNKVYLFTFSEMGCS